ncbi:MAG: DNA translocase FtsK [Anaerolineae bacterium]|nr:DNA translocase FtsK [Anaerolineae bacterium]
MRERLEFQSDRIEAVLSLHKIPARVTGGTVTPRWIRFQVLPMIGTKISKIKGLSEELAAALDAPNCRVSRRGAAVDVEVPRDDPMPVQLLPLYRQLDEEDAGTRGSGSIPPVTAVLGLAEDGAPLLIRLPSPDVAHILVAGTTGSGKTVLMQTMILSLAMANPAPSPFQTGELAAGLRLMLIDPKGYAFGVFQGLPHLARDVIQEANEAAEALQSLVHLMERQGDQAGVVRGNGNGSVSSGQTRAVPVRGTGTARVVVVIDELADLLMVGGKEIQWALTRLTQRGREAGIHIIAATQKPSAEVLGPLIKANFPVRLVGRVTCASDARTATGWSGTGAERLMGRGDFLAVAEGRVMRFQAAHVSPEEIREVVAYLAQNEIVSPSASVSWTRPLTRLAEVFRGGM